MDAIEKMYEESLRKKYAFYRGEGTSQAILLNDPTMTRQKLISQLLAVSTEVLIDVTSEALSSKKEPEAIINIIASTCKTIKLEKAVEEAEKQKKRLAVKAYENSEPWHMYQTFSAFTKGVQKFQHAMQPYKGKTPEELNQLYSLVEAFDPTKCSQPNTMANLKEPLLGWILTELTLKNTSTKKR